MKTKNPINPAAAFPDAQQAPVDADLKAALGPTAAPLHTALAAFRAAHPDVGTAWQFSAQSGWYQLHLRGKRRLLYLIPQRGDFRLMLILGGKALADLKKGPFAKSVVKLLETAPRYPEGTAFSFNSQTLVPDLLAALLAAKLIR